MILEVDFGAAQTGLGYRFYDSGGALLGTRVTTGIVAAPGAGHYLASVVNAAVPVEAVGVYWDCANADFFASSELDRSAQILLAELYTPTALPAAIISAPTNPGQVIGYLYTYDGQGNLLPETPITFQLVSLANGNVPGSHQTAPFTLTSAAAEAEYPALLSGNFHEGATYRKRRDTARREAANAPWEDFIVPLLTAIAPATSFQIPQNLGVS